MILLYDAECGLCRWAVVWTLDHDRDGLIEPLAIQSPRGGDLLHDLEPAARLSSAHVITPDGRRASGGAAVEQVLEALPNRALARAARLSPRATDAGYRFVATHRVRISRLLPSSSKRRATAKLRELEVGKVLALRGVSNLQTQGRGPRCRATKSFRTASSGQQT